MNNFVIAQVFGIIGIFFSVLSMQMKTKKNIMIMLLCLNLASALNFLFLDSISGCFICFFAVFETFINYLFDSKQKKVPIYILCFYVIVNVGLGISAYHSMIDLLPIVCALLYCATVYVKRESNIRKLMFANQSIWLVYDILVKAYLFSISNILTIISIMISYFRFDFKEEKKNGKK